MHISRLVVRNFRNLTALDVPLRKGVTCIIGENNTGKTAVLDAVRFALRDIRSRRGCAVDAYDFHLQRATSEPTSSPEPAPEPAPAPSPEPTPDPGL